MNQSPLNTFSEKLLAFLGRVKGLLSKDYSLQDLRNLKNQANFKSLSKTLQQKLSVAHLPKDGGADEQINIASSKKLDIKQLPQKASLFVIKHRNSFVLLLLALLLLLINAFLIAPFGQRIQNQLDMRPAQWSQLQSLIKLAKSSSASGASASQSMSYGGGVATVTLLDDMELQKIRNVLTSRGLKPNVLRLTADNPPRIEFQSSDTMFSVLLDVLDELRITWRLYPEQLNVVASSGAGVVNISGVLAQHGGQAGVAR